MVQESFDRDFNKSFLVSLGAHALLAVVAFVGGEFVSKIFRSDDIEVIRSSVRVDVVGMPKFTVQELKKMEAHPVIEKPPQEVKGTKVETEKVAETSDVIKKDDLVIQEKGKKKESFLNMLSDYSSKKVVAKKAAPKGTVEGTATKHLDSLIIEGNRLSKGSALVGDHTDAQDSEFSAYVQNLPGIIRPYWKLPSYLLEKDLKCRIKIYLSKEGKLLKLEVQESSGVAEFDARAESAVREAVFPSPSGEVAHRLTKSGIILGFPI